MACRPDLTVLGKVLGGGLPAAAFGGRRELMGRVAPAGDVYQAGTLSGQPARRCRGLATLERLDARRLPPAGEPSPIASPPGSERPRAIARSRWPRPAGW